jgi:hypothetical protein
VYNIYIYYNSIVGLLLVFFCFFLGISRDLWVSLGESLGISRAHHLWGSRGISYIYGDVRNHPERSWSFGGGRSPKEINIVEGSLEAKLPTIWTVETQSREEAERRERLEERRGRCAKR